LIARQVNHARSPEKLRRRFSGKAAVAARDPNPRTALRGYCALIPSSLMIGHHFSISDGTQLGVGEFAGLRVVGMV
jgi:hypothetical protein